MRGRRFSAANKKVKNVAEKDKMLRIDLKYNFENKDDALIL